VVSAEDGRLAAHLGHHQLILRVQVHNSRIVREGHSPVLPARAAVVRGHMGQVALQDPEGPSFDQVENPAVEGWAIVVGRPDPVGIGSGCFQRFLGVSWGFVRKDLVVP